MNVNIAASNVVHAPSQGRTDLPPSTGAPSDGDTEVGDPTIASKGDSLDFGKILSGSMKSGRNDAQTTDRRTTDSANGLSGDGVPADPADATTADQRLPVDLGAALDGKVDASKPDPTDPLKASKAGDDRKDDPTDAVSSDVAAQLALATQWASTPPPHTAAQDDAGAAGDKAAGEVAAKGDDRRANIGRVAANRATLTAGDVAQVQAAAIPAALTTVAFNIDRNARSTATAVGSAIARSDSLKDEATRLATPESKTVSIDRLFNLAAAHAPTTSNDPATVASQFVSQISAQVSNAQNSLAATASTGGSTLHESVGTPAWSHELGQAAIRMATNDLQTASLRLNPEHLGPLDVQIRIDNGVAHMQFMAAHADTRHALESSRTTLDQMFGDQGIKLGDWSVGQSPSGSFARSFGAASSQGDGSRQSANPEESGSADATTTTVNIRTNRPLGLVDTFA